MRVLEAEGSLEFSWGSIKLLQGAQRCTGFIHNAFLLGTFEDPIGLPGKKNLQGTTFYFCSDLPRRASEIQFSLALLQISFALKKLYIIILKYFI